MDAIECLKSRRSIRQFKNEPVREEDLETLLECARLAPSGHNRQPWEFFVTRNRDKLQRLSEVCTYGKFLNRAYCCVVVTGNPTTTDRIVEDCSAATENMLLAAHALGYGGCWIAGWNTSYEKDVLDIMGIEHPLRLVSLAGLGVPEQQKHGTKRVRDDCVHFVG
jgi:nitroreductase